MLATDLVAEVLSTAKIAIFSCPGKTWRLTIEGECQLKPLTASLIVYVFMVVLVSASASGAVLPTAKPNVILVSIDTLAADNMGIYGYSRHTTPNLAKFASESVLFENTFSQAAYTLASHYSIFSGLYADTHKVVAWEGGPALDPKYKTLTEFLKADGYRTVWAGTTTDPQLDLKRGLGRGFDEIHNVKFEMGAGLSSVKALLKTLPGKPFFLFLHTYMVHDPYHPIAPFDRLYDPGFHRHIESNEAKLLRMQFPRYTPDPKEDDVVRIRGNYLRQFNFMNAADRKHIVALYDGGVQTADLAMREVFTTLKQLGIYDNSLIVVTSDHGEAFGQHGHYYHLTPTHEEIHVPLIMKIPGIKPARVSAMTLSIDILPTILESLKLAAPSTLEGRSVLPLLRGETASREEYFFSHGLRRSDAVWNLEWKLHYGFPDDVAELYHIMTDPMERNDIAWARPEVVGRFKAVLDGFRLSRAKR